MLRKSNLGFHIFTDAQRAELHSAAMEVLESVGVEIHSDQALEVAKSAGAYVEGNRVRFPAPLVETCIRSTPSVMGGVITILDMSVTQITYGSPEFILMVAGLSEMAHYYQIPMLSTAGCSDSKSCDGQHAAEISQNLLMAAMSGGNLIHDSGYMESGACTSLQSLVIADEIIGQVKRLVRGIEVNEKTLALDVIAKVGPGGDFMSERHTCDTFHGEWFFPTWRRTPRRRCSASSRNTSLRSWPQRRRRGCIRSWRGCSEVVSPGEHGWQMTGHREAS